MVKIKFFNSAGRYLVPTVVTLVLLAVLVIAVTGDTITLRSPANTANFSSNNITGTLGTVFNITFINDTEAEALGANATFWINLSASQWLILGNSTPSCLGGGAKATCSAVLNASALDNGTLVSDGYYTVNATIYNGTNGGFIPINGSNMSTVISINNLVNLNTSNVNSGTNHSTKSNGGNLTLNVSFADHDPLLINTVTFHIINSTGDTNKSISASREGATQHWSTNVNTSHFADGNYTIVVAANDTLGNFNSTANVTTTSLMKTLFFDNTPPSVSFSCSPSSVDTGESVTCSCSGSATSGISSTSFTASPSTSDTGTFTETCSVTSRSGLSGSTTAQYTVSQSSSGGSPGGSSGGDDDDEDTTTSDADTNVEWESEFSEDDEEFSDKGEVTQLLAEKEKVNLKIGGETHHVGVKSISEETATLEVSSTPVESILSVGESQKFEVTGDNFYDMEVTLISITNDEAELLISPISEEVEVVEETAEEDVVGEEGGSGKVIVLIVILVLVVIAVVVGLIISNKRKADR